MKREVIGSYTTYYRSQMEHCLVDANKCDLRNMELLGFSKFNPYYLAAKVKFLIKEKSRTVSLISRLNFL